MPANRVVSNPSSVFDARNGSLLPEQRLWGAVIIRAIRDLLWDDPNPNGPPGEILSDSMTRRELTRARDEALVWLNHDHTGFGRACDLAGLNPDYMRGKIRALLETGYGSAIQPGAIFDD